MLQVVVDLVVEGLAVNAGAAPARPGRVPALDHKVLQEDKDGFMIEQLLNLWAGAVERKGNGKNRGIRKNGRVEKELKWQPYTLLQHTSCGLRAYRRTN